MKQFSETYFRKIYVISGILIISILMIQVFIFISNFKYEVALVPIVVMFLCTGIWSLCFIYFIKYGILKLFRELNQILDKAEKSELFFVKDEENEFSKFAIKLKHLLERENNIKEQIKAQKDTIEHFISDISHQIRTPISNICIFSQLLEERELEEEILVNIHNITTQAEKLTWLIETLAHLSRLETGIIQCKPEKYSVKKLLIQALNSIYIKAERKMLRIELEVENCITAYFDLKWTTEAIVNLLENSVKYTKKDGYIKVAVVAYEMYIRIDITDNGIGIKKSEWASIFRRFYRSKEVIEYEGVGIGLYLSREILVLQGGFIKVYSEPKKRTTFSVFLPKEKV